MRSDMTTFQLVSDYRMLVRHKLRCLFLTIPGERVMYPQYGIGIQRFLFENAPNLPEAQIQEITNAQLRKYMPYVQLQGMTVGFSETDPNTASIKIQYTVPSLGVTDFAVITI
mgnify:FL=1